MPRSRARRNAQAPKQAKAGIKRDSQETYGSPERAPTDQYQHFVPRFILRRFQVGPVKSDAERREEFRRTGIDPEFVHYYDVATGSLDIRPIGKVYGIPNVYQDDRSTEDINELEKKLAVLECQTGIIIADLHKALPLGTFTLKRRQLELLRKFLFIMHYRNAACSTDCFQADHPDNAQGRRWIESLMKAKGMKSAVEGWLYFLRYFLDTSHHDIMRDAAELLEKYGLEGLLRAIAEPHLQPDLERFPAIAYHGQAQSYFLSVWEAAEGEEFVLTDRAFGIWEGLAGDRAELHYIFVVSPRIAIVLRSVLLPRGLKDCLNLCPFKSILLNVDPEIATKIYSHGGDRMPVNFASPRSVASYRSSEEGANDSFVFKITKLSRPQTLELNSVVLINVNETGSVTFLSKEIMLRTTRAFRSSPRHLPQSNLIVPLIDHLTATMGTESSALRSPLQPQAASPEDRNALSLVDVVLYVLLMQICTGRRQFPSAYDRAYVVLTVMEKAKPTSFEHKISREVEKAFQACKVDLNDEGLSLVEGVSFAPLIPSIPDELSRQLFHFMIPYMSKLGAVMSGGEGGKEILEDLQDEVAVVSFLSRASCSPGVWHALSCSDPKIPKILSRLFKEYTRFDISTGMSGQVFLNEKDSESDFSSSYDRAYALRRIFIVGPTTNPVSETYYGLTAAMIRSLGRRMLGSLPAPYCSQPRERPKAQLVRTMSKVHSDLLLSKMKIIVQMTGYMPSSEDTPTKTLRNRMDEMSIVSALAWLGKHRRNYLDFMLDRFLPGMNFKLFEDEEPSIVDCFL